MGHSQLEKLDILFIIFVSLIFAFFLYQIKSALIPLVLAIVLIVLLLPYRDHDFVRHLIWVVVGIFTFWFLRETKAIVAPFFIAFALAYLFDPLVTKLEKRKIPRLVSVSIIVSVTLGSFALLGIFSCRV